MFGGFLSFLLVVLSKGVQRGYIVNTKSCPPRFTLPGILPEIHVLRPCFQCNLRFAFRLLPVINANPHIEYTARCTPSASVIYNNDKLKLGKKTQYNRTGRKEGFFRPG